jgi:hypothetical protein
MDRWFYDADTPCCSILGSRKYSNTVLSCSYQYIHAYAEKATSTSSIKYSMCVLIVQYLYYHKKEWKVIESFYFAIANCKEAMITNSSHTTYPMCQQSKSTQRSSQFWILRLRNSRIKYLRTISNCLQSTLPTLQELQFLAPVTRLFSVLWSYLVAASTGTIVKYSVLY